MSTIIAPTEESEGYPHLGRGLFRAGGRMSRPSDGGLLRTRLDAEAAALGVRIATRCKSCGHWLVSMKSRAAHQGPKCASKSKKVEA